MPQSNLAGVHNEARDGDKDDTENSENDTDVSSGCVVAMPT